MNSLELNELLEKVKPIVVESGDFALTHWNDFVMEQKGDFGDKVTDIDRKIEETVSRSLKSVFPEAGIVGEEFGGDGDSEYYWVIDPIDGTKEYTGSMPFFTSQVALLHNNEPILGVIYNPNSQQVFLASRGNGAFLNEKRIDAPIEVKLENAVVDVDFGGTQSLDFKTDILKKLFFSSYRTRVSGGRFAPYLVTGGIHAFVILNPTTKIMDQAPRRILFEEAGYSIEELEIAGNKISIAAASHLLIQIKEVLSYD